MSKPGASINTKLVDSLAQIILSLTSEERQLLSQKIQSSSSDKQLQKWKSLQQEISIGVEQLKNGEYTEYDDSSLPSLLEAIKIRGKTRLQQKIVGNDYNSATQRDALDNKKHSVES